MKGTHSNKQKKIWKLFKKDAYKYVTDELKEESTKRRKRRTYKLKNKK